MRPIAHPNVTKGEWIALDIPGSASTPDSSNVLPSSGTVMEASSISLTDITERVRVRDACAKVARGEALKSATGFSYNSPLATSQSSAFFSTPGTPCAYSGLEIITPADLASCERKSLTAFGASLSRSGLKWGRSAKLG